MQSFRLLEEPLKHSEPTPPVTEEETAKLIAAMSNNKASGDDGIDAVELKLLPPSSVKLITRTFNKCLEFGYFPAHWKRAEVVMIPKPGKPETNLAFYRPISLLPKEYF